MEMATFIIDLAYIGVTWSRLIVVVFVRNIGGIWPNSIYSMMFGLVSVIGFVCRRCRGCL